ncbi:MAG: CHASE2 domain-containing protein [Luteolibacter sp.]
MATLQQQAKKAEQRIRLISAVIGISLTVVAGYLALTKMSGSLWSLSYDIPYLAHSGGQANDVRIVYLDELDGEALDRSNQAVILDRLNEFGAKAVVYDLIFDRPSKDPEVDREFAAAMLRFRGVDENWDPIPGARQRSVFLACGREMFEQTGAIGERLIPPTDQLLMAADDFGLVALVHDKNYVVRKLPVGTPDEPGLSWKAALALGGPIEESNRLSEKWINYAGSPPKKQKDPDDRDPPPIASFKASELMRDDVPSFLQDKVVVVGAYPGIVGEELGLDLFSSPFHRFDRNGKLQWLSGVEIQANSLANLLRGNWLTRSSDRFDTILICLAGLIAGFGFSYLRPLRGVLVALITIVLLIAAAFVAMHEAKFWFAWSVVAFLQVPVALSWGGASHFYIERFFRKKLSAEQEAIREAFAKYLSPQMLDRLTEEGFSTNLGGEKIQAAMMFTDLEGFTDMCERVGDPERIVDTLNGYFERTTGSIFDHDGVIIKYIGDAIFAAWGAPINDPEAPIKAVRAAWELNQNDKLVVDGHNIRTRIGIHSGEVVAGNLGSSKRVDYTLIGDAVNLSARLEGINKIFDTSILMSGSIQKHIDGEFITRLVGKFCVKGKKDHVDVYELIGPAGPEPEWIAMYREAFETLEQNNRKRALELFTAVNKVRGDNGDGSSRYFIDKLNSGEPMPDGIVALKEK